MRFESPGVEPPAEWPYATEATVCAACGRASDRHLVVDSLGLVWGAATRGGLAPSEVGEYVGTLEFRCCTDCWTDAGVAALDGARTLLARETRAEDGRPFALDARKVAAAARLDAQKVAVADLWPLGRTGPELEHVRAQDAAVEDLLASLSGE
ncbi:MULTISPECIES: hypothetical protein [Halorussus]|uniref:hypothetical protein n=1 Tax=Halorussus TaxID=1070314 RepID=UPI00209E8C90|nr:hypothetical protein [Halorussus vallis]USZ75496.1 hypothetical protein NGM07_18945 [Halorussus vallis]